MSSYVETRARSGSFDWTTVTYFYFGELLGPFVGRTTAGEAVGNAYGVYGLHRRLEMIDSLLGSSILNTYTFRHGSALSACSPPD